MSLLSRAMRDCVLVWPVMEPDGEGGYHTHWVEDKETFKAAITFDTSIEAKIAEVYGVKSLYTVTTGKERVLMYNDIIKRLSDGKIFAITSDGDDRETPVGSNLNMRQCSAKEYSLY